MNVSDLIKITGQHLLFLGVDTYSWRLAQFQQAAQFAQSHGVDTLLVKTFDGADFWYGGLSSWHDIRQAILAEGVGAIPYGYCYGNSYNALDIEINNILMCMQDSGIVCADMEQEYNGQVEWAQHLCSRIQEQSGVFMVSTWADPSLQNWQGVIAALAPATTVFMPQQYNNYLATFWQEFGNNGAQWLQPTVNLTQDFGANDPVGIAQFAHDQGHTAISVWHYDTAVANPGLLDAVHAAFPKGGTPVQTYGPGQGDFDQYFIANSDGSWVCKKFNTALIGGNLALYRQLSVIPNILPLLGLPRTNELYQTDESDGYSWSVQFFERGLLVYDPEHRQDSQPGLGTSYLGKYGQFAQYDPLASVVERIPVPVADDIKALAGPVARLIAAAQ